MNRRHKIANFVASIAAAVLFFLLEVLGIFIGDLIEGDSIVPHIFTNPGYIFGMLLVHFLMLIAHKGPTSGRTPEDIGD